MRLAALLLVAALAGCCGTSEFQRPPASGEPWDTTYLIDADPSAVTTAELTSAVAAAEARLLDSTVEGVVWPRYRSDASLAAPDRYGSGGDSLLFTGVAAATWAWKYGTTGDAAALTALLETVRGLHLMTHATGTPGVLCRCALPIARAAEFGWPWSWREPFVNEHAGFGYYTRATRDQVSGLVLGLAATWRVLDGDASPQADQVRTLLREIGRDVLDRLEADRWRIRDENGKNRTNADDVTGLLRLGLEAFVVVAEGGDTTDVRARLEKENASDWEQMVAWTNRFANADQYYAHNLRVMRSLTVAMLSPFLGSPDLLPDMRQVALEAWWQYVNEHRTAWFDAVWMALGGSDRSAQITYSLKSWSLRPARSYASPYAGQEEAPLWIDVLFNCTGGYPVDPHLRKPSGYFAWQKAPWDTGSPDPTGQEGVGEDIGLTLAAPYWLWRWTTR